MTTERRRELLLAINRQLRENPTFYWHNLRRKIGNDYHVQQIEWEVLMNDYKIEYNTKLIENV